VALGLRHWVNRPQHWALITISSRNEGDDEDHFTSYSLFIDGSYFGQINSQSGGYLSNSILSFENGQ
jgi:hypothetical protein